MHNFLSFSWRYVSFFNSKTPVVFGKTTGRVSNWPPSIRLFTVKYFFIMLICNCFWIISCKVLNAFVFLLEILLPIKLSVASAVFWIAHFERLLSMIKKFLTILTFQVLLYVFTKIFAHIFAKIRKSLPFFISVNQTEYWVIFIFYFLIDN